nr:uncharacterized protein LOC123772086 isoform X1 [Procambarus clarkii]
MTSEISQWYSVKLPSPFKMERCVGTGKGALISDQKGASPDLGKAAGTSIKMKPKLMLKPSGFGDDNQFMAAVDNFIPGSSSDLNTPEIKFNEKFSGTHTYSYSDSNMQVETETASSVGADFSNSLNSAPYPSSSMAFFDLSPPPADGNSQSDQVEDLFELDGSTTQCDSVKDSNCFISATSEPSLCRPKRLLSPSDFLVSASEQKSSTQVNTSSTNFQPIFDPVPSMPWNDDFEIPPDILEQMCKLLPDSDLPDNGNPSSTELDMYLGEQDLLSGALDKAGILDQEEFEVAPPSEAERFAKSELPTEGAKAISQVSIQQDQLNVPQGQTSGHWLGSDSAEKPELPSRMDGCNSMSRALKYETVEGFEVLVASPSPASGVSNESTASSSVGPIRGTRQRRNSRKPLRFRDTVPCDDLGITQEMELPVASPSEPVATISGHTTRHGRRSLLELTEQEKYQRIRELNNMASKKCRQKRKATVKEMEEQLVTLKARNDQLKKKEANLRKLRDKVQMFVNDYFRKRLTSDNMN